MTQARSGAVRVAVGQLIWSSHAAPAARTPRPLAGALAAVSPTAGHAVQPPPRAQGRNGQPPGHRTAGRQPTQPQARCRKLAYLPTASLAGQRSLHGQCRGNQPSALPHTASTAPSRQTRPRRPPDPASVPSATCPGSTGSADDRAMDLTDECTCDAHHCDTSLTPKVARAPRPERTPPRALRPRRLIRLLRCRRRRPG